MSLSSVRSGVENKTSTAKFHQLSRPRTFERAVSTNDDEREIREAPNGDSRVAFAHGSAVLVTWTAYRDGRVVGKFLHLASLVPVPVVRCSFSALIHSGSVFSCEQSNVIRRWV
ncbi:PREDICTED: uncharacterized protein LOC106749191 [Dinoponera quadriceps]|uniref:Uncharacterized protein LOC106749191 n=1 Tax=Dinoponera quadriceps TaxID=609295 RepID=A0A6P3Y0X7_DINQU|nr:PREDICTED: uncharacterized protein LOC106749191 [Dinoponera quadriceps]